MWDAGACLNQMTSIPALDIYTIHSLLYIVLSPCLILSKAILIHQCKIMIVGRKIAPSKSFYESHLFFSLLESLQKMQVPQWEVEFYVNKNLCVGVCDFWVFLLEKYFFFCYFKNIWCTCVCMCVYIRVEFLWSTYFININHMFIVALWNRHVCVYSCGKLINSVSQQIVFFVGSLPFAR